MTLDDQIHRHRCEVRTLIRASAEPDKGRRWVRGYLADPKVAGRREQLRADINEQMAKGNTGEGDAWL